MRMTAPSDEYVRRYMEPGEAAVFREKVVSKTAFGLSIAFAATFGLVGLFALGAAALGSVPMAAGLGAGLPSIAFAAFMGITGILFSVFRTIVTGSHVHVHFGWAKRKIPMAAIQSVEAVTLRGFKQGKVSMGVDGVVRTWVGNSQSGRGVEITYQQEGQRKHVLTVGSEDAEGFASAVQKARAAASGGEAVRLRVADRARDEAAEAEAIEAEATDATARARR
jgi:hypothetical protein